MALGMDCGTYNLIRASRNKETDKIECIKEVNAFFEMPLDDRFTFNMMLKAGVPLIEREKVAYALGQKAVDIAYSFPGSELRRPMSAGCVNPREKEAFQILTVMMHSLIGEIERDGEVLCYSVPANALNEETDADYHGEVLKQIFTKYEVDNKKVMPYAINEGLALVYAELQHKFLTGIGISFGAGMTNLCFANRSVPIFKFSLVNSGDWIDRQAGRAIGEEATFINKEKTKIDLSKAPTTDVERAITTQYRLLISKTMRGIKNGLDQAGKKARTDDPVDIILAGGTASPPGFDDCVRETIEEIGDFPVEIGEIKRPKDHLYAVARGCLLAAEASEDQEG